MLSQSEMIVVFVPREKITQGSFTNGGDEPKFYDMVISVKCRSDEFFGNEEVKRGKPREREIQNWQESPNEGIERIQGPVKWQINVCRQGDLEQNMAYLYYYLKQRGVYEGIR